MAYVSLYLIYLFIILSSKHWCFINQQEIWQGLLIAQNFYLIFLKM